MLYQHKFLSGGSRVRWIIICFAILLTSNSSWSMKMPKKKDLANNNAFILAEQVWSLTHTYLFVINFLLYRKIPKISPGAYIFQRAFLRGLFLEGLIFGGAYLRREICVSKSIRLTLQLEVNLPFLLCFTLYLRGIFQVQAPGGLIFGGAI